MSTDNRNPLIIPDAAPRQRGCPKCHAVDFSGRRISGVASFTCRKCGNKWEGGLPMVAADPRDPVPVESFNRPPVFFDRNPKDGKVEEIRRRVDTTQDYRKGAPIPEGEE